jgi:SAM-dependent methyltransferase
MPIGEFTGAIEPSRYRPNFCHRGNRMNSATDAHRDQIDYWNSAGGEKWIAAQEQTDAMLAPVSRELLAHARVEPGMAVIDLGCGCGATTLELVRAASPGGRILAVDVSEPMLARARARLAAYAQVDLVCADAAVYPFTLFADLVLSRFGVMFFGDPTAAFANIRRALKPGGRLVFACWRKLDENPWMQVPLQAAYGAGIPHMSRPGPEDPGPFSFADPERVTRILTGAGFNPPRFAPADISLDIAAGRGLAAAVQQSITIGATSRALRDQPEALRLAAIRAIETALKPYAKGPAVELSAAIWIVESETA